MQRLVIVDANYICMMVWHTKVGRLRNGVLFGALKQLAYLQKRYAGCQQVWCFDASPTLRRGVYEGYKQKRREKTREAMRVAELEGLTDEFGGSELSNETGTAGAESDISKVFDQIKQLKDVFSELGVPWCWQDGYEADDFVAALSMSACYLVSGAEQAGTVLVTNDEDAWQLLSNSRKVSIYRPSMKKQQEWTQDDLEQTYGVSPGQWSLVKAIAGCESDEVPGIPGIGEKLACKYLLGFAPDKIADRIRLPENQALIQRNFKLTNLPWIKWPEIEDTLNWLRLAAEQQVYRMPSVSVWEEVVIDLEMPSLKGAIR